MPLGVVVTVERDIRTEMPDGSAWYGDGISAFMPSERSASGWKHVHCVVESVDVLAHPEVRQRYCDQLAYGLMVADASSTQWETKLLRDELADAIEAKIQEALPRAT